MRKKKKDPEQTPELSVLRAHLAWLKSEQDACLVDLEAARKGESHTAVAQLRNRRQSLQKEFKETMLALIARQPVQDLDESDMTPAEWRERVEADARIASIDDLETYLEEWLRRRKIRLEVRDGLPVLLPLA